MKYMICFAILFISLSTHANYKPDPVTEKRLNELKNILTFVNGGVAGLDNLAKGNPIQHARIRDLFQCFELPNTPTQLTPADQGTIKATLASWSSKK